MLNLILSITGSDINVDAKWVVMKFTHENVLCIKIPSVRECITLIIYIYIFLYFGVGIIAAM